LTFADYDGCRLASNAANTIGNRILVYSQQAPRPLPCVFAT